MSDVMIRVENLTKDYGSFRAVNQVTFIVRKGEVLGFLGPNGAGKSTTMKMLTCYLAPTAGTATVAGHDVFDDSLEVRRRLGYLPEDTPLYRDMTVLEYLEFAAEMRNMAPAKRMSRIKEAGGRCGLGDVAGKLVGELSKGYRQRLDEPTSGRDPNQIVEIRELIKELGKEKTVILSTHILPEVQATCTRILIISGGKLVADDTPEALRAREKGSRYRVLVEANGTAKEALRDKLAGIGGVARCELLPAETGTHGFALDGGGSADLRRAIFRAAVDNHWPLLELVRESVSLEEVFRHLTTNDETREENPS